MTIADTSWLWQLWNTVHIYLSHLTAGAIGGFVTWFVGIRKMNAEVREINKRTKKTEEELLQLKRTSAVRDILLRIKIGVSKLPPNVVPEITPDPGDDLQHFAEAKVLYEEETKRVKPTSLAS